MGGGNEERVISNETDGQSQIPQQGVVGDKSKVAGTHKRRTTSGQSQLQLPGTVRRRRASSAGEKLHFRRRKRQPNCNAPVVHVSETHDYMKSWNPYITEGYRLCASYKDCLLSLFYFHNCWWDTMTALFNIVHSLLLFRYINQYHLDDEDKFVFGCFFLTAWVHSLPSAAYHLIGCSGKSYMEYIFYQRLDFLFIFISSIPLATALGWYTFYSQPIWFWVTVGGVVLVTCKTASVIREEMSPERRLQLVGGLVFFYFVPVLYCIVSTVASFLLTGGQIGLSYASVPEMWWAVGAIAALTMGAYTYGAKFPECVIPNFPFSSHSWMHLGVNLAYLSEFFFIVHQFWLVKRHPQNVLDLLQAAT